MVSCVSTVDLPVLHCVMGVCVSDEHRRVEERLTSTARPAIVTHDSGNVRNTGVVWSDSSGSLAGWSRLPVAVPEVIVVVIT